MPGQVVKGEDAGAVTARWRAFRWLADHVGFLVLALGYISLTWLSGRRFPVVFSWVAVAAVPLVVLFEVTRLRWRYRRRGRPGGPMSSREAWRQVGRDLAGGVLAPVRLVSAAVVLSVLGIFMDAFIAWKQSIPAFREYTWDVPMADLDALLHFGVDPWRLTHLVFGAPWLTRVLDVVYVSWYTVLAAVVIGVAFAPHTPRRTRFLVTYLLVWIVVGTLMAAAFASGGPVYFEQFTGGGRFAPLLERLSPLDLRATMLQDALWRGFTGESGFLAEGIAAMPSVHVGLAVLFAVLAWPAGRWIRWLAIGYAVLIQIGSVHLGWHYAVDGYVAAVVTLVLWVSVGVLQGRLPLLPPDLQPHPRGRPHQPRQDGRDVAGREGA